MGARAHRSDSLRCCSRVWHANYTATGGFHKGSPIVDTDAALAAFLRRCAANQSKRFRQVNRIGPIDPDAVAMPSPFGND